MRRRTLASWPRPRCPLHSIGLRRPITEVITTPCHTLEQRCTADVPDSMPRPHREVLGASENLSGDWAAIASLFDSGLNPLTPGP
jgi:hypothetical protein